MPRSLKLTLNALAIGLVAALVGLFAWQEVRGQHSAIKELDRGHHPVAPSFTLKRLGGGTVSLAALRGHPVIVNFWATWCGPCKEESAELERTYQRYKAHGLVIVGIDTNDLTGDMKAFVRKHGLTYPIVRDHGTRSAVDYGVIQLPETFFVNRQGRLVGTHVPGGVNASDSLHALFQQGLQALQLS